LNCTSKLLLVDNPPCLLMVDKKLSIDTLNSYVGTTIFMAYSGYFKPTNPQKYRGNPTNIVYRSLWERKFMVFCDNNPSILQWGSEEIIIPYRAPDDTFQTFISKFVKSQEKLLSISLK
jgi:hypothetical protein